MEENIYKEALKRHLRFAYKGLISIEDLMELNVRELDKIFKVLNAQLKSEQEDSLLSVRSPAIANIELGIAIIKNIVADKMTETLLKSRESEKRVQKQKILEIITKKQDHALEEKSVEELTKMLDGL